jgi:hypothetical protein
MPSQALKMILLLLGTTLALPAGAAPPAAPQRGEAPLEVLRARSSGGSYLVEIRSAQPIPLNQLFSLEFRIFEAADPKKPIENARITLSTWMPDHQHGGSLEPQISYRDDGSLWGEGLLFHMEGLWQLRVGVMANGLMERVVFDIDMEP